MGAALGYLRSLKNENPNLGLRYLHLEDVNRSAKETASVIVKLVMSSSIDSEFSESSGHLRVNRWAADSTMTKITAKTATGGYQDSMALGESQAPLKLMIDSLGQPKSTYFAVDESAGSGLGDDEVEVEVKATILRFVLFLLFESIN